MQCITCYADIPPSFVHAIQTNICAGCGGPIMDEPSRVLLLELKEAMNKMPNDAEGLSGWLLTNYDLIKKGTGEPTNFHRAGRATGPTPDSSSLKWNNNSTQQVSEFAKNAGVDKIKPNSEWSAMVQALNSVNDGLYGGPPLPPTEEESFPEERPPSKEENQAKLYEAAKKKGSKLSALEAKAIIDGNNELYIDGDGNPISEPTNVVADKASLASVLENSFIADQSPVLQGERMKRLKSQYLLQNGSAGFRRGG